MTDLLTRLAALEVGAALFVAGASHLTLAPDLVAARRALAPMAFRGRVGCEGAALGLRLERTA